MSATITRLPLAEIRCRWAWDGLGRATSAQIALAVRRTRNPYGITVRAVPYIKPRVGMLVAYHGERGRIMSLRLTGGDPEARILLDSGRTVYLFQTALRGYSVIAEKAKATHGS